MLELISYNIFYFYNKFYICYVQFNIKKEVVETTSYLLDNSAKHPEQIFFPL